MNNPQSLTPGRVYRVTLCASHYVLHNDDEVAFYDKRVELGTIVLQDDGSALTEDFRPGINGLVYVQNLDIRLADDKYPLNGPWKILGFHQTEPSVYLRRGRQRLNLHGLQEQT